MLPYQVTTADGPVLRIERKVHGVELVQCKSTEEAEQRCRYIEGVQSWVGTPFVDNGAVRGRKGAVDCVHVMACTAMEEKIIPEFTIPKYNARHAAHSFEEQFLHMLVDVLHLTEVNEPKPGDIALYHWRRVYSHGGVIINKDEIVHAHAAAQMCLVSPRDEPLLKGIPVPARGQDIPRPVKYFTLWT